MKPDDTDTKPIRKSMAQRRDEDAAMFRAMDPKPARPPIERYVRCSVEILVEIPGPAVKYEGSIEAGLQLGAEDQIDTLREELRYEVDHARAEAHSRGMTVLTRILEERIAKRWPDRAWFVEVWNEHEALTQVYAPYGMPRR